MCILRALVFLFLVHAILAEQPTPVLPDPKLTPGDTFDVTAQAVCVSGYAKKVRAVPSELALTAAVAPEARDHVQSRHISPTGCLKQRDIEGFSEIFRRHRGRIPRVRIAGAL